MLRAVRQIPTPDLSGAGAGGRVSAMQQPYRLSRRQIARHRCLDCGINVIKAGDYLMLRLEIWEDQFGLGWEDNLCLQCIERRLGRRITMHDTMNGIPTVAGHPMSAALYDRIVAPLLPKQRRRKAKPKRPAG